MTGYAAATREIAAGASAVELNSVNPRFLDLQFRVPEELRALEPVLREAIAGAHRARQGRLPDHLHAGRRPRRAALAPDRRPCSLRCRGAAAVRAALSRGARAARGRRAALARRARRRVARRPTSCKRRACMALVAQALDELDQTRAPRRREARRHAARAPRRDAARVAEAAAAGAGGGRAYQEKLAGSSPRRRRRPTTSACAQEIALFAAQDRRRRGARAPRRAPGRSRARARQGRRRRQAAGFPLQELNREANTLGSKAVASEMTRIALELKLLIEQMREQVQNIE